MAAGLDVEVVSQFCFNPSKLLRWLTRMNSAMEELRVSFGNGRSTRLCVGLPGPTKHSRLLRISEICQVPSSYASVSMFRRILGKELAGPADFSCLGQQLRVAAEARAGGRKLGPPELAVLLAELSKMELETSSEPAPTSVDALGPSAFVASAQDVTNEEDLIFPEDLLWSVAAFAQESRARVSVNLYPFGGLAQTLTMAEALRSGCWSRPRTPHS